jgi:hypothetical protein
MVRALMTGFGLLPRGIVGGSERARALKARVQDGAPGV